MDDTQADRASPARAGLYGRLSETYDAGEVGADPSFDRGTDHAARRDWTVVATFKDDGYSAFKEVTRDGFGELIAAMKAGRVDVVIVRDIDRLTRNLTDWNALRRRACGTGCGCRPIPARYGTVHGRGLRRDGDAAGAAGKRGQERPGPRSPGPRSARGGPVGGSGGSGIRGSTPTRTSRTIRSGTSCGEK